MKDAVLFFICETLDSAEVKAAGLRRGGYNTEIKLMLTGPYTGTKSYRVYGRKMDIWQFSAEELQQRKRKRR